MADLSSPCFYIENGKILEARFSDFVHLIEMVSRPSGTGYVYYATNIARAPEVDVASDEVATAGGDAALVEPVWVLAKWARWGGPEVVVREYASEALAKAAAEAVYVQDILANSEVPLYLNREAAERSLGG